MSTKKERSYSEDVIKRGKEKFRGSRILKVADRFTTAIPDIEILWLDTCSWIEMKVLRKRDKLKDVLRMDQLVFAHELGTVCGGRAYFCIYNEHAERTEVWIPRLLAAHVFPSVIGVVGDGPVVDPMCFSGPELDVALVNFQSLLIQRGMLFVPGWCPELPVRVVYDAIRLRHGR